MNALSVLPNQLTTKVNLITCAAGLFDPFLAVIRRRSCFYAVLELLPPASHMISHHLFFSCSMMCQI